jgi:acyl-homoserine lactone acylase PvdQ
MLTKWNYVLGKDSIEATLYQVWERLLQNNFIKNI